MLKGTDLTSVPSILYRITQDSLLFHSAHLQHILWREAAGWGGEVGNSSYPVFLLPLAKMLAKEFCFIILRDLFLFCRFFQENNCDIGIKNQLFCVIAHRQS